jgi:hypothetical protein
VFGLTGVDVGRVGAVFGVKLDLDDEGVATDLPRPEHRRDEVQQVPYRPVQYRDDDLPTALERAAAWLRAAQQWLGEPSTSSPSISATTPVPGSPYYEVKLLCSREDLAGAPLAARCAAQAGGIRLSGRTPRPAALFRDGRRRPGTGRGAAGRC